MPNAVKTNGKNAGDLARSLGRAESPVGAHGVRQFALPSDRGSLEVSGANLMYEGARVKSWMLGRDVNPAGRGDGAYYAQSAFRVGSVRPSSTTTPVGAWGNSVNNGCANFNTPQIIGLPVFEKELSDPWCPPNTLEKYDYDYSTGGLPSIALNRFGNCVAVSLRSTIRHLSFCGG